MNAMLAMQTNIWSFFVSYCSFHTVHHAQAYKHKHIIFQYIYVLNTVFQNLYLSESPTLFAGERDRPFQLELHTFVGHGMWVNTVFPLKWTLSPVQRTQRRESDTCWPACRTGLLDKCWTLGSANSTESNSEQKWILLSLEQHCYLYRPIRWTFV